MTGQDYYQPAPNEGDQIKHRIVARLDDDEILKRVRAALVAVGRDPAEADALSRPILLNEVHEIALRLGRSVADFLVI